MFYIETFTIFHFRGHEILYGISNKLNYSSNASISVHRTFYLFFLIEKHHLDKKVIFFFTLPFRLQEKRLAYACCNKLYFDVKKTKKILLQSLRSQLYSDNESSFQYGCYVIQGVPISIKNFQKVKAPKQSMSIV